MKSGQIGLQLYTVRRHAAEDMTGALRRVAEIGYGAVEFAGLSGTPPRHVHPVLETEGIRAIGAHVPFVDLETRPVAVISEALILGCDWVVVPSVPVTWLRTAADVGRLAKRLDTLGGLCHAEGTRLAFHNHDAEFSPLDGSTPWEMLVAETAPDLVDFELDLYWAAYAGRDPVELIRDAGRRIRLLHMKDLAAGDTRRDAPVGEGVLPWPEILAAAREAGVSWYIVEQDEPVDPFADVERSLHNLRRLAGLRDETE